MSIAAGFPAAPGLAQSPKPYELGTLWMGSSAGLTKIATRATVFLGATGRRPEGSKRLQRFNACGGA